MAEALDRLSRDQEDTAALYKQLGFAGVRLVTLAEGEISARWPQGHHDRAVPEGSGDEDTRRPWKAGCGRGAAAAASATATRRRTRPTSLIAGGSWRR